MWPVLVVFALTYVLIAARRVAALPVGRLAGALAGACAMVALYTIRPRWGLSPPDAFAAVEPNTIGLLLGMMLLAAMLAEAGFFDRAAAFIARRASSPVVLLYLVTLASGLLSAILVNDPVCVMLAPLVDRTAKQARVVRTPYLFALAMGANSGSAMTLAGNPQNMLVAHLSGLGYASYLFRAGPAALLALVATAALLHLLFRRDLAADRSAAGDLRASLRPELPAASRREVLSLIAVLAAVSVAFLAGANLAWTALAGASLAIFIRKRDPTPAFARVSWTVLVFFAGLFVVVAALQRTGAPVTALTAAEPYIPKGRVLGALGLATSMAIGCQIVSNVPFILLAEPWIRSLPDPTLAWTTTAIVATLAGNLTLLGSVANIIVVEETHAHDEMGFLAYLKIGIPVTVVSTGVALAYLLVTG